MSRKRQRAVRIGLPALIVAVLTFVALWRVTAPLPPAPDGGPPARTPPPPVTEVTEVLAGAIGRRASLENVAILDVPSTRALWIGLPGEIRVLAVLDPDVKRSHEARLAEGGRVTLIGLVRAAPSTDVAVRQWGVDAATARVVEQAGAYLYVTEVRPAF